MYLTTKLSVKRMNCFFQIKSKNLEKSHQWKITELLPIIKIVLTLVNKLTLREKCPNAESFLVRIFSHLGRIQIEMQENTDQEELRIWTLFTQCKQTEYILHNEKCYLSFQSCHLLQEILVYAELHQISLCIRYTSSSSQSNFPGSGLYHPTSQ